MTFTKCHEDLEIWKLSILLVKAIYKITRLFPDEEKFVLVSQMRRSAISIPSNIAEGAGRKSKKEFTNFLSISLGSLTELETQIIISKELNYIIEASELRGLIKKIRIMTSSLMQKLSYTL